MEQVSLVVPSTAYLDAYVDALERDWSPDNVRGKAAADDQLAEIARDPAAFLASMDDPEARGAPIKMLDGSTVARLPGIIRWIWDGAFCGSIGFRWQHGTTDLPPYSLGHIGFAVVPWKRRLGYGSRALALILADARARRLAHVELTTDPDNLGSQGVIMANGGRLIERFEKPLVYGGGESLRYQIAL